MNNEQCRVGIANNQNKDRSPKIMPTSQSVISPKGRRGASALA